MVQKMAKVVRESINFKLPKDLLDATRAAAKEKETTLTALVIKGLRQVLDLPSGAEHNVESRLHHLEEELASKTNADTQYGERLNQLSQKLETFAFRLDQMERALSTNQYNSTIKERKRSSLYQYQLPKAIELQPFPHENLAQRLGMTPSTLTTEREKLDSEDFVRYTRKRDPRSIGWQFHPEDGLYHPVPQ